MSYPFSPPSTSVEFGNSSPPRCTIMDTADNQEMREDCELPEFSSQNPVRWFREAEAIFREKNVIRQASKFYHVVRVLPIELCGPVYDLMYPSGLVVNVYDQLREQVMREYQSQRAGSSHKMLQGHEYTHLSKRKRDKIAPVVPYGTSRWDKRERSSEHHKGGSAPRQQRLSTSK